MRNSEGYSDPTAGKAIASIRRQEKRRRKEAQRAYERTHTRAEFISLIGKNYLEEDGEKAKENYKGGSQWIRKK